MKRVLSSALLSLFAGLAIACVLFFISLFDASLDRLGLVSVVVRWVHVGSAIIWLGMIWFVNFVQFAAIRAADEGGRSVLFKEIVPRVAHTFRHASHLTLASGVVLLVTTGYILDRWVFLSAVYIATLRSVLLWSGVAAGVAMWLFVHFVIWPNLRIVLDEGMTDAAAKAAARERVHTYARINLVLAIPATFAMVAAAHLF
jgi:uncharacterized membrane protein